ncbi:MAG: dihydrofolate reductase [Aestuariibaculum sp.]
MFGKKKKEIPKIDKDQLELLENAQKRIKQKRRLYIHFVIFLIGCVFLILANTVLGIGKEFTLFGKEWFLYAIILWAFFFVYHIFNVFVTNKFMGKKWEQRQLNKLVSKQNQRIEKLKATLPSDDALLKNTTKKSLSFTTRNNLTLIVAASENNAIGKENKLIWHLSDDLKRFKNLTSGHHIIMGRKTFESFPKPLPNRTHVVISRQKDYTVPQGVILVNSLEEAIDVSQKDPQPFIIGGGEIYRQAITLCTKIEMTRVHETFADADAFFPEIDTSIWKETANAFHSKNESNNYDFSFITYEKK